MHYAVLMSHPGTGPNAKIQDYGFTIFAGKTLLAAMNRAREWVVDSSQSSRAEYEEKHGEVDDGEWLKVMKKSGFIIVSADLHTD